MGETDSQNMQAGAPQNPQAKPMSPIPSQMNGAPGMPMGTPMNGRQPLPMGPHPNPAQSAPMPAVSASTVSMPPQQGSAPTGPMPQGPMQSTPAPAPTLPVAVPGPDYRPPIAGGINPSGPGAKEPKKRNGLLIFGIIVALLAAIVLVIALIYVTMRSQGEPLEVEAPSTATMQAAFEEAKIEPSNLSKFAFIDTDGLDDPEIDNVRAGSVTYGSDRRSATCDATADATWENDSVNVEQTVRIPFTYDTSSNSWQAGKATAQSTDQKVTPTGPANIEAIQTALPNMLEEYDPEIAKQFTSPEIAATANLDKSGGEITFALDQLNADESHTQTDVNVGVVWEDGKGWKPTINWVGEIQGGEQAEEGTEGENAEGADQGGGQGGTVNPGVGGNGAEMLLTCTTGDLVEVPGIIEYRDNRVLLRSDYTIHVVLDGRTYVCKYFELTANTFVVTNGAHVSVVGEISATGTLEQAPIMLNLDYES